MQVRQSRIAAHQHLTPDEWVNAAQDDPQLVEVERCGRGCHALRVAQSIMLLKGSPRYLTLSPPATAAPPGQARSSVCGAMARARGTGVAGSVGGDVVAAPCGRGRGGDETWQHPARRDAGVPGAPADAAGDPPAARERVSPGLGEAAGGAAAPGPLA